MKQALFIILALVGMNTATVLADSVTEAPAVSVESNESKSNAQPAPEEAPADDLYSSPANDPNLLGEETEGRLRGHEFGNDNRKDLIDYSGTSERYPSTIDEE